MSDLFSASSPKPKPKKKAKSGLGIVVVLVVAIALIALALPFAKQISNRLSGPEDFPGPGAGTVSFVISEGETLAKIGNNLKAAGVVASVDAFTEAAAQNPDSAQIAPGTYELLAKMRAKDALELLIAAETRLSIKIAIPEGKRATSIFTLISDQASIPLAQVEAAAAELSGSLPQYAQGNLEGFLHPATYTFSPGVSAKEILTAMLDKHASVVAELGLEDKASALGYTPYEILIVASLLEVEAHPRDFQKVARVVYNRLNEPMRLQFDSTVNYGLGKTEVILTTDELETPTAYNTYLNDGLPPTPVGNPGSAAIEAALNPEAGDWLYFITIDLESQETAFTSSYSEFLGFKDQFLSWCAAHPGSC